MRWKRLAILFAAVILLGVLLLPSRPTAAQQVTTAPGTEWIESLGLESPAEVNAPSDLGSDAAILATELLLTPVEYFSGLPMITR